MFLLRCGFWLSLVYAGLLWPGAPFGRPIDHHAAGDITRHLREEIAPKVARRALDYCQTHAQTCLSSAARLNTLVEAVSRGGEADLLTESRLPASRPATQKPGMPHRAIRVAVGRVPALAR